MLRIPCIICLGVPLDLLHVLHTFLGYLSALFVCVYADAHLCIFPNHIRIYLFIYV